MVRLAFNKKLRFGQRPEVGERDGFAIPEGRAFPEENSPQVALRECSWFVPRTGRRGVAGAEQ